MDAAIEIQLASPSAVTPARAAGSPPGSSSWVQAGHSPLLWVLPAPSPRVEWGVRCRSAGLWSGTPLPAGWDSALSAHRGAGRRLGLRDLALLQHRRLLAAPPAPPPRFHPAVPAAVARSQQRGRPGSGWGGRRCDLGGGEGGARRCPAGLLAGSAASREPPGRGRASPGSLRAVGDQPSPPVPPSGTPRAQQPGTERPPRPPTREPAGERPFAPCSIAPGTLSPRPRGSPSCLGRPSSLPLTFHLSFWGPQHLGCPCPNFLSKSRVPPAHSQGGTAARLLEAHGP